ncbi:MAG: MdtK family multidrug efflux MATE transporter [Gammaproteobacteria bacterium]
MQSEINGFPNLEIKDSMEVSMEDNMETNEHSENKIKDKEHLLEFNDEIETIRIYNPTPYKKILQNLMHISFPFTLDNFLIIGTRFGDAYIISLLGTEALAANAIIVSIRQLALSTNASLFQALQPIVGEKYSQEKYKEIGGIAQKCFLISGFICLPWMVSLYNIDAILLAINQPRDRALLIGKYFKPFIWGLPGYLGLECLTQLALTIKKPYFLLPITTIRLITDLVLSYNLAKSANLNITGLGIASAVYPWITLIIALTYLRLSNKFNSYELFKLNLKDFKAFLKQLLVIGVPIALSNVAEYFATFIKTSLLLSSLANSNVVLAAYGISNQLVTWLNTPTVSIATAVSILVAQAAGNKSYVDFNRIAYLGLGICLGIILLFFPVYALAYKPLTSIFINVNDIGNQAILEHTKKLLPIMACGAMAYSAGVNLTGALRGLKSTKVAFTANLMSSWLIMLGGGYLLSPKMGVEGVILAQIIGLIIRSMILFCYWQYRNKQDELTASTMVGSFKGCTVGFFNSIKSNHDTSIRFSLLKQSRFFVNNNQNNSNDLLVNNEVIPNLEELAADQSSQKIN